jgi:hypothetical protein
MAQQRAERCINPSEEVIQIGQLWSHFLVTGDMVAIVSVENLAERRDSISRPPA